MFDRKEGGEGTKRKLMKVLFCLLTIPLNTSGYIKLTVLIHHQTLRLLVYKIRF
jgi:hypothetical protein